MSRLVDIDNYLVLENGTIKETSFKQDIQIQNQTLMINEDAKVQIIYKTTEEGTYHSSVSKSIEAAKKNFKKFYENL